MPYTYSDDSYIKSAAIIALWQFPRYRAELETRLQEMLHSTDTNMILSGIYTVGEVQYFAGKAQIQEILSMAQETDTHLKKHCYIALIKLKESEYIPKIVSLMMNDTTDTREILQTSTKLLFSPEVDSSLKKFVFSFLQKQGIRKIHEISAQHKGKILEEYSKETLQELRHLYSILKEETFLWKVEALLGQ